MPSKAWLVLLFVGFYFCFGTPREFHGWALTMPMSTGEISLLLKSLVSVFSACKTGLIELCLVSVLFIQVHILTHLIMDLNSNVLGVS